MNPFDLQGPAFLGFWLAGWVVVIGIALVVRARVGTRPRERVDVLADKLHPTEIAFLFGDIDRAIEAAIAGLHHRGVIELVGTKLHVTGKAHVASRMESYVLDRLPARLGDLREDAAPIGIVLRRRLEEHGLLVENQARATQLVRLPAYLWLLAGASKLALGFARDKPVFLLLVLILASPLGILALHAPRLTAHGRALERLLRTRYAGLEATARAAPQQLDAADMTLAYGVFGAIVAPVALMTVFPPPPIVATSPVSSCGSVDGDCSSGCGGCGGCSS